MIPDGRLDDLVVAAIGRNDPLAAWTRYVDQGGVQAADDGERRLYPFVARSLAGATKPVPQQAVLRSERRKAVVRVERAFAAAARAIDLLDRHNVEALLLKGQALQVHVYREAVLRVSSDVDLFITPGDLARAITAFATADWVPVGDRHRNLEPAAIRARSNGMVWQSADGLEIDLHWQPRPVLEFDPDAAADFRAEAIQQGFAGRVWRIPSDTWLLFEAIEHGLRWNEVTPVRWLVDAVSVIEAPHCSIDWDALMARIDRNRLTALFAIGLNTLARYTDAIPPAVLDRIRRQRPAWCERRHARLVLQEPRHWLQWFERAAWHYALRGPGSPVRRLITFPGYYWRRKLRRHAWHNLRGSILRRFGGSG